jgi:hypothetical protein
MSDKISKAILDLKANDWDGINNQGRRFLEGMYKRIDIYPTPPIAKDAFTLLVETSEAATTAAIEGSKHDRTERKTEGTILYKAMSLQLIPYINTLWSGNRSNLEASGAKTSVFPSPVPRPDPPQISRVAKGPEPNTVKVYLVRGVNSGLKKRSRTEYRIFMFVNEDDLEGKDVGSSFNSTKLFGSGIPNNVIRYYGVIAKNSGGTSDLSSKAKFYLLP